MIVNDFCWVYLEVALFIDIVGSPYFFTFIISLDHQEKTATNIVKCYFFIRNHLVVHRFIVFWSSLHIVAFLERLLWCLHFLS